MRRSKFVGAAAALGVLCALPVSAIHAQPHRAAPFYGRSFHSFSHRERRLWQGGHWTHGWHGGQLGWWWVLDGWWYLYPAPVYPYPIYVPPSQYWYFCPSPRGYYPSILSCPTPWRAVPAPPGR